MGYVEETGAAQFFRDVRITSIYEGTNGIQAADLVMRKLRRDRGATMTAILEQVRGVVEQLQAAEDAALTGMGSALGVALADMERSTQALLTAMAEQPEEALGAAFDYLMQAGYVFGGWHLGRSALIAAQQLAAGSDNSFYQRKLATASFYMQNILPRCASHAASIAAGGDALREFPVEWI
jgi:hypothetical protein